MALKVELKPGERLIIGGTVITNGDTRTQLLVEGHAPILREKDILTPETANSPARRIYLAVQMMYLTEDISELQETYFSLIADFMKAVPSSFPHIEAINHQILTGQMYKALKQAKHLLTYEEELLKHA
ncbi:MAG: flagellar biosynthesis repressor FlbT [Pseudomonadota bacterium]